MPTSAEPSRGGVLTGTGLVLLATVSVQLGAGLARSLFDALGPGGTVFLRLVAATACLVGVSAWQRRRLTSPSPAADRARGTDPEADDVPLAGIEEGAAPLAAGHEPWPRGVRARIADPRARAVWLFGLVLAAMNTTFYFSIARIPLGLAVAVEFAGPLALTLLLSRRPTDVVWALLAASGLGVLVLVPQLSGPGSPAHDDLDPLGLALAAFAGACWAGYILCARRVGALVPGVAGLGRAMAVATLLTLPLGVAALPRMTRPLDVLAGLGVGLLSSAIPYGVELEALRLLPARVFGVLLSLDPVVAALSGLVVLGQALGATQWAGIALVCAASAGATWAARDGAG